MHKNVVKIVELMDSYYGKVNVGSGAGFVFGRHDASSVGSLFIRFIKPNFRLFVEAEGL